MLETSARLLRVLALLQSRRYWPGAELAERLDVTGRTLRRDIQKLRDLGYTIDSSSGAAGGYQLGRGAALPPLLLEDEEAVAVAIGLRVACASAVTGMEAAGLAALAKFEHLLPERLRRRVNALATSVSPLTGWGYAAVDARAISTLASACHDHEILRFPYRAQDGAQQTRRVEPHQLVHTGSRWYLVAWDLVRDDWRTFRADRIRLPIASAGRFAPRPAPEGGFAKYVSRSVSYAPYTYRARIVLHASVSDLTARIPPTFGVLEALGPDRAMLSTGAHSLDVLCMFLALTGVDFEVLEPPELLAQFGQLHGRLERALAVSSLPPSAPPHST